jgi:hypothetical protein
LSLSTILETTTTDRSTITSTSGTTTSTVYTTTTIYAQLTEMYAPSRRNPRDLIQYIHYVVLTMIFCRPRETISEKLPRRTNPRPWYWCDNRIKIARYSTFSRGTSRAISQAYTQPGKCQSSDKLAFKPCCLRLQLYQHSLLLHQRVS